MFHMDSVTGSLSSCFIWTQELIWLPLVMFHIQWLIPSHHVSYLLRYWFSVILFRIYLEVDFLFSCFIFTQRLVPHTEQLNLSYNRLDSVDHLHALSRLRFVDLSHNVIKRLPAMHVKLGNVTNINLSHNKLDSLQCEQDAFIWLLLCASSDCMLIIHNLCYRIAYVLNYFRN